MTSGVYGFGGSGTRQIVAQKMQHPLHDPKFPQPVHHDAPIEPDEMRQPQSQGEHHSIRPLVYLHPDLTITTQHFGCLKWLNASALSHESVWLEMFQPRRGHFTALPDAAEPIGSPVTV